MARRQQAGQAEHLGPVRRVDTQDTAGSEKFRGMVKMYYRKAACCMIVYDITDKNTFLRVEEWYQNVKQFSENENTGRAPRLDTQSS